jgi:cell division inhibitor SulA
MKIKDRKANKITKLTKVSRKENKITPQLRISGNWLRENGFKINKNIEILVREELLIIQPLKDE